MKRIFIRTFSILLAAGMLHTPQFQSVMHADTKQNTITGISLDEIEGDVNGDGVFNVADVIVLKKILLNASGTNQINQRFKDIQKDGKLNVLYLCALKRKLLLAADEPQTTTIPITQTSTPVTIVPTTPITTTTTATAPTTQTSTTPSRDNLTDIQAEMLKLVNEQRRLSNVPELSANNLLNQAAQIRASELVESFSHTRPDGGSCFSVFDQLGIYAMSCGENIAYNYSSSSANELNQWMNSAPHKENILDPDYTSIGIGVVETDTHRCYWVQLFMR